MSAQLSPPTRAAAALPAITPVRWRAVLFAALAVVLAVATYKHVEKARDLDRNGQQTKTAFLRWRNQIQGLEAGQNIYRLYKYPNPPIQALILYPFTELPQLAGSLVWFFLKAGMAAVALVWTFRLVGPMPWWAKAAAVALSLHAILGDLSHGNVNIFIAFLVIGAMEAHRRGWDLTAGLVLALSIACKVTPALFLPYFGWKAVWSAYAASREGRPVFAAAWTGGGKLLAGATVGLGLWLAIVPGAVLGWDRNAELLESWYGEMVRPFLVEGKVTPEHANQSIPGVVHRLLTNEPSDFAYDEDGQAVPKTYHNLTDVGPNAAQWVTRGCQAAWVLAVVLLCRAAVTSPASRRGMWVAAEYSLVVLGMLLFSERTWKHHGVTLMLPFAVLLAVTATRSAAPGLRWFVGSVLVASGALILIPSALGRDGQDLALTYGTHTAAFLLLTAAVCAVMGSERAGPFSREPEPSA
jgi:hypothetical protein